MGEDMPEESKKKPEVTTTASNIRDILWTSEEKQIRKVKLASEKAERKKKE